MRVFAPAMTGLNAGLSIAFLRAFDPPWRLVAAGAIRTFNEQTLRQMVEWMEAQQRSGRGVFVLAPRLADGHLWLAARLPLTASPASLSPPPQLTVAGDDFTVLWKLVEPVSEDRARQLVRGLVAGVRGARDAVGAPVPLPGTVMLRQAGAGLARRYPVSLLPPARAPAYHVVGDRLRGAGGSASVDDGFERADQLKVEPMRWLWPGILPAGEFALLAGPPKVGKSTLAVDLAARLTNGTAWPDGAACTAPAGVIMLETEDPIAATQARLRAAGANMQRVMLSSAVRDLSAAEGVAMLERQRVKLKGGAGLLILSPVRLFFGDVEAQRQVDMRGRLAPLLTWASANGVTVLGIAHRETGKGGRSAEDVAGPRVFAQRARAVLSAIIDPADRLAKTNPNAARRMLTTAGSNLGADSLEVGYRIVSAGESSRVVYEVGKE